MKTILFVTIALAAGLLSAREMNPSNPDFDHSLCLKNHAANPSAGQTRLFKKAALETLVNMKTLDAERQSIYSQMHPAYKTYYGKLSASVRSNGRELYSRELDRQLDLSGNCEDVDSVLLDIIKNLK